MFNSKRIEVHESVLKYLEERMIDLNQKIKAICPHKEFTEAESHEVYRCKICGYITILENISKGSVICRKEIICERVK